VVPAPGKESKKTRHLFISGRQSDVGEKCRTAYKKGEEKKEKEEERPGTIPLSRVGRKGFTRNAIKGKEACLLLAAERGRGRREPFPPLKRGRGDETTAYTFFAIDTKKKEDHRLRWSTKKRKGEEKRRFFPLGADLSEGKKKKRKPYDRFGKGERKKEEGYDLSALLIFFGARPFFIGKKGRKRGPRSSRSQKT